MSRSTGNNLSSSEDKRLSSTLALLKDNDLKLKLIVNLNKIVIAIEEQNRLGQPIGKDVINEIKDVALSIKQSHTVFKDHVAKVNPQAKPTEEAHNRITRNQDNESEDIARILFSINQTNDDRLTKQCGLNFPAWNHQTSDTKNGCTKICGHVYARKWLFHVLPGEIWEFFKHIESNVGAKCLKY